MAVQFPPPGGQTPANTFSPTSTPFDTSASSGLTYVYDTTIGAWISTSSGGGVASVSGVLPITVTGAAALPTIAINPATDTSLGSIRIATAAEAAAGTDATRAMTPSTSVPKVLANMTGAAIIPGGDDTERTAITAPIAGMLRYNDTTLPAVMEYYDGSAWVELSTGGGGNAGDPLGWFGHMLYPGGISQLVST